MATEKQIAANQLNALKSTGPRSEDGKQASSMNAVKHGLSARKSVVLLDESEEEFAALCQSLRNQYRATTPMHSLLVDTLAGHLWRLQRVPKFEAMLLQSEAEVDGEISEDQTARQLKALKDFVVPKDVFGKISRHEAHLLREIARLMSILDTMSQSEKCEPSKAAPETQLPAQHPAPQQQQVPPRETSPSAPDDTYNRILNSMSESRAIW